MPLTQVDQGLLGQYAQYTGFKNRIINGDMRIDQRNAGAAITSINSSLAVDRFKTQSFTTGSSIQRSAVAPSGFTNSLLFTVGTGASPAASNSARIFQVIEGFNVADLGFGTANAQPVTISFWVRSSLTGTLSGGLYGTDRSYVFTYQINSANTWEYKTITILGDTSGTWLTDNSQGMVINFDLGSGSDYQTSSGAWGAGVKWAASGATKVSVTSAATFYITGVQLEKGSTATSFDYRPYGTELALCQRYYQTIGSQPGTGGNSPISATGMWYNATTAFMPVRFGIAMRTGPTVSYSSLSEITLYQTTTAVNPTNVYINVSYPTVADLRLSVASGGTSGQATVMQVNGGETKGVFFSAEL